VPEGDTIFRAAAVLRSALVGRELLAFDAPRLSGPMPNVGTLIEEVRTRGKHLEIVFDDGMVLHTHMRMTGSWHVYRPGEKWRKDPSKLRVGLEVPEWIAVCFSAPVVEVYRETDRRRHPGLGSLGPDLCQPEPDLALAVERWGQFSIDNTSVADALLDQRVAAGVGNVYKSEVLWACRLDPFVLASAVSSETRRELLETATRMLQANLGGAMRVTAPQVPGGLAVYGRAGKPCPRCNTPIEMRKHGQHARVTYWCPTCQLVPVPAPAEGEPVDGSDS
jgi:endonuclease-8